MNFKAIAFTTLSALSLMAPSAKANEFSTKFNEAIQACQGKVPDEFVAECAQGMMEEAKEDREQAVRQLVEVRVTMCTKAAQARLATAKLHWRVTRKDRAVAIARLENELNIARARINDSSSVNLMERADKYCSKMDSVAQ